MTVHSYRWQNAEVHMDAAFASLEQAMIERDINMVLVYSRLVEMYSGVMVDEERMGK